MANKERIEVLKRYVEGWEEMRDNAAARRDSALILKDVGVEARDDDGVDVLQKRAEEADKEAALCHQNVIRDASSLGACSGWRGRLGKRPGADRHPASAGSRCGRTIKSDTKQ